MNQSKSKKKETVGLARNWQAVRYVHLVRGYDRLTPSIITRAQVEINLAGIWVKVWQGEEKEYFIPHIHIDRIEL